MEGRGEGLGGEGEEGEEDEAEASDEVMVSLCCAVLYFYARDRDGRRKIRGAGRPTSHEQKSPWPGTARSGSEGGRTKGEGNL